MNIKSLFQQNSKVLRVSLDQKIEDYSQAAGEGVRGRTLEESVFRRITGLALLGRIEQVEREIAELEMEQKVMEKKEREEALLIEAGKHAQLCKKFPRSDTFEMPWEGIEFF